MLSSLSFARVMQDGQLPVAEPLAHLAIGGLTAVMVIVRTATAGTSDAPVATDRIVLLPVHGIEARFLSENRLVPLTPDDVVSEQLAADVGRQTGVEE
jgi:hypothetical protein